MSLTIEHFYTCKQNTFFETTIKGSSGKSYHVTYCETPQGPYLYGWHCECPDYLYRHNDNCKHIKQAMKLKCKWGSEAFMGSFTTPNPDGTCPECGGETKVVRVAI